MDLGKMDTAVERIRNEAASLGANGVLLQSTHDSVTTEYGNHTSNYGQTLTGIYKTVKGMAIFVIM